MPPKPSPVSEPAPCRPTRFRSPAHRTPDRPLPCPAPRSAPAQSRSRRHPIPCASDRSARPDIGATGHLADHRPRRQARGHNRPFLFLGPAPSPFRPGYHLNSRHRTVSCTGASTVICTGATRRPRQRASTQGGPQRTVTVIQTVREKFTCRSCEKITQPPWAFSPRAHPWGRSMSLRGAMSGRASWR